MKSDNRPSRIGSCQARSCMIAVSIVLLNACLSTAPSRTDPVDPKLASARQASLQQTEQRLAALLCARQYAEAHWQSDMAADIGNAALVSCAKHMAAYAAAARTFNQIKAELVTADAGAADRDAALRWADEELARHRSEVRAAAVRRALELQRPR